MCVYGTAKRSQHDTSEKKNAKQNWQLRHCQGFSAQNKSKRTKEVKIKIVVAADLL